MSTKGRSFDILQTARLTDSSYTTKGADPTRVGVYVLRPYDSRNSVILTEFFGSWTVESGDDKFSGLSTDEATAHLMNYGLPSIQQIEDLLGAVEEQESKDFVDDGIYGEA